MTMVLAPTMALEETTMSLHTTRLTCHAPHPDPARRSDPCGSLLCHAPGLYEFVGVVERIPDEPDGYAYQPCPRKTCKAINKFRVTNVAPVPATQERTLQERLAARPEDQQQAILALAGGIGVTQTARIVGVDRKTITRWSKDPEFTALRRAIAPAIASDHIRTALEGFFAVLEKDRKKGVAHNMRWFLSRTVFADFERQKAQAGSTSVSVHVQQQQQMVQQNIQTIWERRSA